MRKGLYWNVAQRARTEDKSRLNDLYHSSADPTSGPGWPSDVFEHPPWFPFWESADRYRREAEQAFKRQRQPIHGEITAFRRSLEAYLTLIRDRSQTLHPGEVEEALEMRADGARTDYNDDHARRRFERLALYCAGVETREIADREGITQRAVQKSNRELAELIGLGC